MSMDMQRFLPALVSLILLTIVLVPAVSASSPQTINSTATPIKHVVEIMMENHAFDNLFGVYPNSNGFSGGNPYNLTIPLNFLSLHNSGIRGELRAIPNGTYTSKNPVEGYMAYHGDWNNGQMNGFVNYSGPQSMNYFSSAQVSPIWDLAEQYALADNFFASSLTETTPNRLYNIAGYSPVFNDYGPPPFIPFKHTIFGQLQSNNITWGYYVHNASMGASTMDFISGIPDTPSHIQSWSSFYTHLDSNSIPAVSYVMPVGGGASGYSMKSPQNILKGEMWLLYTIDSIMHSPSWNSTAIFITFDEGGGFYDQVAPPTVNGQLLGQRVPMLLISPYAKENYISNTMLSHDSLLAFIDYNWGLPALNTRVGDMNLPLDLFNFNRTYANGQIARGPVNLTVQNGFPVPSSAYFNFTSVTNSIAPLFPMVPQVPFNQLNYSRTGSNNLSLSSVDSNIMFTTDPVQYPWYVSQWLIVSLAVMNIGLGYGAFTIIRRRHE